MKKLIDKEIAIAKYGEQTFFDNIDNLKSKDLPEFLSQIEDLSTKKNPGLEYVLFKLIGNLK